MKTIRAILCFLLAMVLSVPTMGLSAAAGEDSPAETEVLSESAAETAEILEVILPAEPVATTDTEDAPASETDAAIQSETAAEPETDPAAETVTDPVEETERTAETLSVGTAGTWPSCDVLVEGTLCYDYAFEVLDRMNALRDAKGLAPLTMDEDLLDIAMTRAIQTALYWEHQQPDGSSYNYGFDTVYYTEIIAKIYSTPKAAVNGWKNSSGHYERIVRANLKSVGVGVFKAKNGNYLWVAVFTKNTPNQAYASSYSDTSVTTTVSTAKDIVDDCISLTISNKSLSLGDTATFKAKYAGEVSYILPPQGLVYESSDETVCTVSEDGVVTAVGGGTAAITAWYPGYEESPWTFTVTVTVPVHDCAYEGAVTTQPGCETPGVMTYTCTVCRASYTEDTDPAGHEMSTEGVTTKAPGCATFGKLTYSCLHCDYTESELISPTGHVYDSGEVTLMPSADADGSVLYTCTLCGKTKTESLPFLLGDVNADGVVTPADLVCLMKLTAGADGVFNRSAADVNADRAISLPDVIRLTRHLADSGIALG